MKVRNKNTHEKFLSHHDDNDDDDFSKTPWPASLWWIIVLSLLSFLFIWAHRDQHNATMLTRLYKRSKQVDLDQVDLDQVDLDQDDLEQVDKVILT